LGLNEGVGNAKSRREILFRGTFWPAFKKNVGFKSKNGSHLFRPKLDFETKVARQPVALSSAEQDEARSTSFALIENRAVA